MRIAGHISREKKTEWQEATDNFLKDPLTAEGKRNIQELLRWYENETEVKKSVEELKISTQEKMDRLETSVIGVQGELERTAHVIEEKGPSAREFRSRGSQRYQRSIWRGAESPQLKTSIA